MEGLGLVSVSGKIGKVSPRSRLDQTFKRLGLEKKVSFTSLVFGGCPVHSKALAISAVTFAAKKYHHSIFNKAMLQKGSLNSPGKCKWYSKNILQSTVKTA